MPAESSLEQLAFARRIADHADRLGVLYAPITPRAVSNHLGAILADTVLQAGLSYESVVRVRVERIRSHFPRAATLTGVVAIVNRNEVENFLLWNHHTKVGRFVSLVQLLASQDIQNTKELKSWLCCADTRDRLLELHGIGPKSYDYLCCLAGIDCVAVDRHIRSFATEAGVPADSYENLKSVVSYAADLLGIARRDFDAWIWRTTSAQAKAEPQMSLILHSVMDTRLRTPL